MTGTIPSNLAEHLLTEFHIDGPSPDGMFAGLRLQSPHGIAIFAMTRQQLLDLAEAAQEIVQSMPKGS